MVGCGLVESPISHNIMMLYYLTEFAVVYFVVCTLHENGKIEFAKSRSVAYKRGGQDMQHAHSLAL